MVATNFTGRVRAFYVNKNRKGGKTTGSKTDRVVVRIGGLVLLWSFETICTTILSFYFQNEK